MLLLSLPSVDDINDEVEYVQHQTTRGCIHRTRQDKQNFHSWMARNDEAKRHDQQVFLSSIDNWLCIFDNRQSFGIGFFLQGRQ